MILDLSFIDKAETKKKTKERYVKQQSLKQLEALHFKAKLAKYPGNPAVIKPSYRDDSANGLTRAIIAWLKLNGYFAARINTMGTYNAKLGKYIRSGSTKGIADIQSVVNGLHISVEVKIGNDKMRPDQLKVKSEIEKAGGIFIIVSSFDNFLEQIKKHT